MKSSKWQVTSDRERRLWCWVGLVLIAIFSTIGLARSLADILGDKGFGVLPFILGLCLVLLTIITNGLRVRPGGREIAVSLGIAAVYLLVVVRMAIPTERSHLVEYGVLAVFILAALRERTEQGRPVVYPPLVAVIAASAFGVMDEIFQILLPQRVFDWEDVLFNTLASVMAVASSELLRWIALPRK